MITRSMFVKIKQVCRSISTKSTPSPCYDNASHGGIPIGAVLLNSSCIQPFRDLINATLRQNNNKKKIGKLSLRGVARFVGPRNQSSNLEGRKETDSSHLLLIHVPPVVATALDDGHPELVDFLTQHDGVYTPGLRRSRIHKEATRKKRHAHIPTYAQPRPKVNSSEQSLDDKQTFTFSELFAGIGGFRLGLEAIGGRCVFANEIDPHAASIYRHNFASSDYNLIEADILDLCANTDIPADTDILTAGFPCQPFSARGSQHGLSDERGQLYRELVRVLRFSHPKSFIFENVAGLVSMGKGGGGRFRGRGLRKGRGEAGSVFRIILQAFEDCGYDVTWNICNSRHWVAQQRERVFIVGVRKDLVRESSFTWDWYDQILQRSDTSDAGVNSAVVRDIMEPPDSLAVLESELSPMQWAKLQEIHMLEARERACIDIYAKAPTLISSYRRSGNFTSKFIFSEADRRKRDIPRFLTPRECCRIMGFPEDYMVPSIGGDGDNATAHFYSGIGNAVVPQIVTSIGEEVMGYLRS